MNAKFIERKTVALSRILQKKPSQLTFREVISLIFHLSQKIRSASTATIRRNHKDSNIIPDNADLWLQLYSRFTEDMTVQERIRWPILTFMVNTYEKRIDVKNVNGSLIETENLLMLLAQILFIENGKRMLRQQYAAFPKVLGHKIQVVGTETVANISTHEIFLLLEKHLQHYIGHTSRDSLEHRIATSILKLY